MKPPKSSHLSSLTHIGQYLSDSSLPTLTAPLKYPTPSPSFDPRLYQKLSQLHALIFELVRKQDSKGKRESGRDAQVRVLQGS